MGTLAGWREKESLSKTKLSSAKCHATTRADRKCTPGTSYPGVTRADVCTKGWASEHRNVTYATKVQVYRDYGISNHYGYVIDHLIPLEAGGGNQITNLWPEKFADAAVKDDFEDRSHVMICSSAWTLRHAWYVIRFKYVQH